MRNFLKVFVAGTALLAVTLTTFALTLCDYVQPVTFVNTYRLQGSFRYFDDSRRDDLGNELAWTFAGDWSLMYDAPEFGYGAGLSSNISGRLGARTHFCIARANYKLYMPGQDFFAFGQGLAQCSEEGQVATVVLGTGFGRMRDVTPMAKALRLHELLLAEKILPKPLPEATLTTVAQEIGRRAEYPNLDALVVKVVQLIEAAKVVAKLDAAGVLRVREIVEAVGDTRLCGFSLQAGLGYEVLDTRGPRDLVLFGSAEYAYPLGLDTQVWLRAQGTSSTDFTSYNLLASASLVHKLAANVTLTARYAFGRILGPGNPVEDKHSLDSTLQFALVSGWNIGVNLAVRWQTGFEESEVELTVSAGIVF